MKKRLISTLLALCMVLALVPGTAWAAEYVPTSGTCGANLNWALDLRGGTLTISGSGEMSNNGDKAPWCYSTTSQKAITTVRFEGDVTSIRNRAFEGCNNLTEINIPSSVISIGDRAFSKCKSLSNLVIPSSVTSIGIGAFQECENLTSMDIPASVTSIGRALFYHCTGLTNVDLSNSITGIGGDMFSGCTNLTSVEIPDLVTSIGSGAFNGCSSLERLELPASITSIGSGAFENCWNLTNVNIPASVTNIAERAFYYCKKLESIVLPSDITSIGKQAFSACHGLTSIEIPRSVTSIGDYAFEYCSGLKTVNIPSSVTNIGKNAFTGCTGLSSMTIPSAIDSIEEGLFSSCINLSSVDIPAAVTSIGDKAFYLCKRLTDVYYDGSQKQWASIAIGTDNDPLFSAKIHCTDGITTTPKPDEDTPPSSHLDAPVISLTTSANIKEGTGSGVRWDAVDTAESYYITVHSQAAGEYIYRNQQTTGTSFDLSASSLPKGTYTIFVYAKKKHNGLTVQSMPSNILTLTVTGQGSSEPDTPSKPPVVNPPVQPDTSSFDLRPYFNTKQRLDDYTAPPDVVRHYAKSSTRGSYRLNEKIDLSKFKWSDFVEALVKNSMGSEDDPLVKAKIEKLLFTATYRPTYLGGDAKTIGNWPFPNGKGNGNKVCDSGLGETIEWENPAQGCRSYARFVSKYIHGTNGSKITMNTPISADNIQSFFHQWLDPGEHIEYNYYKVNDQGVRNGTGTHALVFLGEYLGSEFGEDGLDGFYLLGYIGSGSSKDVIYLDRISYVAFADLVSSGLEVWDTNDGSYVQSGNIRITADCPIEMIFTANGATLDSCGVNGTISNGFGEMTATGVGNSRKVTVVANYEQNDDLLVQVFGTSTGAMDLEIQFSGNNGVIDTRIFKNVPITATTTASTSYLSSRSTTELYVTNKDSQSIWQANVGDIAMEAVPNYGFETDGDTSDFPSTFIPDELVGNSNYIHTPTLQNGTITVTKRTAAPGDWINVYATPDDGYSLDSLTVTDHRGWPVIVRKMGENAFSFTMPAARVTVTPVFVKVEENDAYSTTIPGTVPNIEGSSPGYGNAIINPAAMNYSDVNAGDWFYEDVRFCHQRYLMNNTGEAEGKFEPNAPAARAVLWAALSRMAGRNTITRGDNWYDRAMIWAKNKGITDGENPLGTITREQMVTMLWRYRGNKYVHVDHLSRFNDSASVSWWAAEAVNWAVAEGIINGSNGVLNPQGNATRAEVAAILTRFCQNIG